MSWTDLSIGVLEEFVAAQGAALRRVATEEGGLDAARQAWRDRQKIRGECRSCRRLAEPGKARCMFHIQQNRESALRSWRKKARTTRAVE